MFWRSSVVFKVDGMCLTAAIIGVDHFNEHINNNFENSSFTSLTADAAQWGKYEIHGSKIVTDFNFDPFVV